MLDVRLLIGLAPAGDDPNVLARLASYQSAMAHFTEPAYFASNPGEVVHLQVVVSVARGP